MAPRKRHDPLDTYREKRDFERTPEPAPKAGAPGGKPRFVIQEHSARAMHWDLRLERDGVAVSWAVPRGVPHLPKVNHLAKQTEDHPLEYLEFHGEIPAGEYGGGSMRIYDHGTYEEEIWEDDKVQIILEGGVYQGRYGLVRTRADDWLIHRMDPPQDGARQPMPERLEPMLATAAGSCPAGPEWAHELKWDGIRALVFASGGRINRILSRNGNDITERYPELSRLGRQLAHHEAILDGELVAFDEEGRPSFSLLQERMGLTKDAAIKRAVKRVPAVFMIFDLLFLDGSPITGLPFADRRRLLDLLELAGDNWRISPYATGRADEIVREAREMRLEGVVSKRLDSTYRPGKRASDWIKVKEQQRQEFVVGGWIEGEGKRDGQIGSLAVGYYPKADANAAPLVYAGAVGTGFSDKMLDELRNIFAPLELAESPFDPDGPPVQSGGGRWSRRTLAPRVHWLQPVTVCEVEYTEMTPDGLLRHPSFKGLRTDKDPRSVVLEAPGAAASAPASAEQTPLPSPRAGKGPARTVDVEGTAIRLSNPDKLLYPAAGFTKGDVLEYMLAIAPVLLPHLTGRPLTMKRYPDGVGGNFFFEKNAPSHRPEWMRTARVPRRESSPSSDDTIEFLLVDNAAGLAWLANLAALELHVPLARAPGIENPDYVVFDLDPGPPATIVECCEVGLLLREVCEASGLDVWAKTSGRKGLQLYVPLNNPDTTYEHTRAFSNALARLLERRHPALVVSKMTKALRTGKVLVDWSQNHVTKTTICVYSLREFEQPSVSTPVTWEEVEACLAARDPGMLRFTAPEVLRRVEEHGDLFAPLRTTVQHLPGV